MVETKFGVSVHVMTALAYNPGRWMSSEELSQTVCTNPSFIRKLLVDLSKANLVTSLRGKTGGVQLARPANKINLGEIYEAISQHNQLQVPEKEPNPHCIVSRSMKTILTEVSQKVEGNILKTLKSIVLEDLCKKVRG